MDFECDFNYLNFCQYSNLGWGFEKSVNYEHKKVKPISNFPSFNYFPCSTKPDVGSRLEKKVSLNISQSLCLRFAYLLEEKGQITVTNGNNKWSKNASSSYSQWNYIRFPLNLQKIEHLPNLRIDSTVLKITGESVCVDNFTISTEPCPLTSTGFDNNFSSNKILWLSQPFSVLIAIITLVLVLVLIGLLSSVMFARRSQRSLSRSKQLSRKSKSRPRHSFQNSLENGTTINSCCDADTVESCRPFSQTFFLPTVVHVRSNPQLVHYSRQSFAVSSSIETSESTPHCRFSLALTEDAQLQLLTNHDSSPPVTSDLSNRNLCTVRHQSLSQESSPSPNENGNSHRPNSIVVVPTFCTPIVDQSESDLSMESQNRSSASRNPRRGDRRRPIRESMNIGYVSESSLCDLPQYDTAVQLLAEHKIKLAQSPDLAEDNEDSNNNDILEDPDL